MTGEEREVSRPVNALNDACVDGQGEKAANEADPAGSERLAGLWQLLKFNLVGVMNTAIDFAVYALLLRLGLYLLTAQCISYLAGMSNSYVLNKFWTFRDRRPARLGEALRFAALNAFTLGISECLLYWFHTHLGLHPLINKAVVTLVTMGVNFVGNKWWVFRRHPEPDRLPA